MDPNAAWKLMMNAAADPVDRADAADSLADWIEGGGFMPSAAHPTMTPRARRMRAILADCRDVARWASELLAARIAELDS